MDALARLGIGEPIKDRLILRCHISAQESTSQMTHHPFRRLTRNLFFPRKTLSYRLFGLGSFSDAARRAMEQEGIVVLDEGMGGWWVTKRVTGPAKHYRHRREGFSGCLAVTKAGVLCYAYKKRQFHFAADDPRIRDLYVDAPADDWLCISFESSHFQKQWRGIMAYHFRTEKASAFLSALLDIGARRGRAAGT